MEPIDRIGRFRIVERLGSGSSRDVFLAEDDAGARVVIKVLAAPHRNEGLLDPLLAGEASAYARLAHPNLVKVVDLFSAEGHFVIALEYLDGASLNVVRAVLKRGGGALDDPASLYVGSCVFAAIAAAHDARDANGVPAPVLHRSVNPSNVMISWDGVVKLGNFNVANVASVLRDSNPGFTWGSYGYLAPEHVLKHHVGPPADVYSASLVLWELLAGRKAIERGALTEAEVLTAMAAPRITPLDIVRADLDQRVRDALRAGLEIDPTRRTITAAELRDVLATGIDLAAERARLATTLERVRPDATRPRVVRSKQTLPLKAAPLTPEDLADADLPAPLSSPGPGSYRMLTPPDPDPVRAPVLAPAGPRPPVVLAPLAAPVVTRTVTLSLAPSTTPGAAPSPVIVQVAPSAPPPVHAAPDVLAPAPVLGPMPAPLLVPPPVLTPAPPPFAPFPSPVPVLAPHEYAPIITSAPPPPRRNFLPFVLGACGLLAVATAGVFLFVRPKNSRPIASVPSTAALSARAAPPLPVSASAPAPDLAPPPAPVAIAPVPTPQPSGPPAPSASPALPVAPPALPSAAPAPAASASSAPPAPVPADRGELHFPPFAAGHRIFVDGHVVGDGADPAVVRCGLHDVQIGSAGSKQRVDVPCGGTLTVTSR